jgi:hypothetical protein
MDPPGFQCRSGSTKLVITEGSNKKKGKEWVRSYLGGGGGGGVGKTKMKNFFFLNI